MSFFHGILGKIGIGISTFLITLAGFIAPSHSTTTVSTTTETTVATSTSISNTTNVKIEQNVPTSSKTKSIQPVTFSQPAVTPAPQQNPPVQSANTMSPPVTQNCAAIESEYFYSVYRAQSVRNNLDSFLKYVDGIMSSASAAGGSFDNEYQVLFNANSSEATRLESFKNSVNQLSSNLNYEDGATIADMKKYLLETATYEDLRFKDDRKILSIGDAAVTDTVMQEQLTEYEDDMQTQYQNEQQALAHILSDSILLGQKDKAEKINNGCDPSPLWVYSDIASTVALNPANSCQYDGYTSGIDATMCALYQAATPAERGSQWKIINRP